MDRICIFDVWKYGNFAFLYFFFYLPKEKSNISNPLYSRQNLHIIIFENVQHFLISLLLFSLHFFQSIQNRQYSTKIYIFQHFEILDICCFISFPSFFFKKCRPYQADKMRILWIEKIIYFINFISFSQKNWV